MRALLVIGLIGLSAMPRAQTAQATQPAIAVTAASRSMQPGELVVLTIVTAEPAAVIRVRAFDQTLQAFRVDEKTWRVFVGIDLDVAPKAYPVTISAGDAAAASRTTYNLVVKPKTFETRTLTVDPSFVNPPATATRRIEEEQARLAEIWKHPSATRLWTTGFIRPVPQAANSAFGKRSVFNGQPRGSHTGADFESPAGTPVKAPNAGRVVLAADLYFSGNTVIIDHGLGLFSLFAHFSSIAVHEGEVVTPGLILGKVGATGRVTGPHLHWMLRVGNARIDPLSLLALVGAGTTGTTGPMTSWAK
jgi:murein DD-endopeptidase MepM/ murein hydrolase activator NlpD